MDSDNQTREIRLKGGSTILQYLKRFSATEKAVFGIFAVLAIVTALVMANQANGYFMTEVPANGGALHEGEVGLPHTMNPILAVTDVDRDISALVYAGLTAQEGQAIVPDLASSWTVSPDGLTYTFTLRSGLEFQNGAPLTADDVVFTVNKIKDPALKSPRAADWSGVTASSTSPTTVVFTLRQPSSSFLSSASVGILPKSIWGGVSDDQFIWSDYNVRPIGAGPYKIASVSNDQGGIPTQYDLKAWSGYHAGAAHISDIVFSFFPDIDHALTALRNGSIDSLSSLPPAAAAELAKDSGEPYRIAAAPLSRIFGVFFNQNKNPALADPAVRQALDLATDRAALVQGVLAGYGVPAHSPFPPGIMTSDQADAPSDASSTSDLAAAQAVLSKAGWATGPDGVTLQKNVGTKKKPSMVSLAFTFYTADTADLRQAADMLKTQWSKLGASVTVKVLPPTELYQSVIRTRDYEALLFGQVVSKPSDLYAFWHSSQRSSPGLNVAMYTNSKADKLLDSIRTATDTAAIEKSYAALGAMMDDDQPAVFLYSPELVYAVPKSLRGLDLSVSTSPSDRFRSVDGWYTETERVWNIFSDNQ